MTLPLPLVAFDDYMLSDDRPGYPMNFFIRMRFSGRVSLETAVAALEPVAARHPLVTAVVRGRGRRRRWERAPETRIPLREVSIADPEDMPRCPRIDVTAEGGMRGYLLHCGPRDQLLWQFHHACCDGLGAFQLLEDWLVAYAQLSGDAVREGALRPLDAARLKQRGHFGLTPWRLLKKTRSQAVGLKGVRQFLSRQPVPIVPEALDGIDDRLPDQYPAAVTHMFTREQTQGVRQAARRCGCTGNDLLARDLFLALGRFRRRHALGTADDWLRLSVPMNLRRAADRSLPAANVVSMVFLDRRQGDLDDPRRLAQSVHDEMQLIKTKELGLTFMFSLWLTRRLPGGLASRRDRFACTATCLLTNLGNLYARTPVPRNDRSQLVVGGCVLEQLDLVAPIRPYTGAAFTPFHYARCLGTTLHYDPRMLTATQAGELLRDYVDCVVATSGC